MNVKKRKPANALNAAARIDVEVMIALVAGNCCKRATEVKFAWAAVWVILIGLAMAAAGGGRTWTRIKDLVRKKLTAESDVHSFGIVLLQLLTPALDLVRDVKYAIENRHLNEVLDVSAGEWPVDQAKQLAHLALWCCERKPSEQPNLVLEVWAVLEAMRDSCTMSSSTSCSSSLDSKDQRRIPFIFCLSDISGNNLHYVVAQLKLHMFVSHMVALVISLLFNTLLGTRCLRSCCKEFYLQGLNIYGDEYSIGRLDNKQGFKFLLP
ncbi:Hypothetical predicted protein [Olea europaea subsp. europaea]|uniref:RING-type E3 ubiquitin transferase n=1 Tax=Olea europaea subsp. europaea TaxID=158383 RepID=A0A8S0VAF7_OLEEU|nr:Hypothetical predicted protein [Olea europaea subsp. europaea]